MTTYVALLRGINVSGQRLIKMSDLKRVFEALGLARVQTYIQSGNVVFEADEEPGALRLRIEQAIEAAFGFAVTTVLRTAEEMAQVVANSPFPPDALAEGERLYVTFLAEEPTQEGVDRLLACTSPTDELRVVGCEVYLLLRQGAGNTIFTNQLLEKKLGVASTARNWNTTTKLAQMSHTGER